MRSSRSGLRTARSRARACVARKGRHSRPMRKQLSSEPGAPSCAQPVRGELDNAQPPPKPTHASIAPSATRRTCKRRRCHTRGQTHARSRCLARSMRCSRLRPGRHDGRCCVSSPSWRSSASARSTEATALPRRPSSGACLRPCDSTAHEASTAREAASRATSRLRGPWHGASETKCRALLKTCSARGIYWRQTGTWGPLRAIGASTKTETSVVGIGCPWGSAEDDAAREDCRPALPQRSALRSLQGLWPHPQVMVINGYQVQFSQTCATNTRVSKLHICVSLRKSRACDPKKPEALYLYSHLTRRHHANLDLSRVRDHHQGAA